MHLDHGGHLRAAQRLLRRTERGEHRLEQVVQRDLARLGRVLGRFPRPLLRCEQFGDAKVIETTAERAGKELAQVAERQLAGAMSSSQLQASVGGSLNEGSGPRRHRGAHRGTLAATSSEDGHEEVTLVLEYGLFEVRLDLLEESHGSSVPACQTAVVGDCA